MAQGSSLENVFASGTLQVDVVQDTVLSVSNWKPGEKHLIEFNVKNTGTMPVFVKGYLAGKWGSPVLDSNMFEILSVKAMLNNAWVELVQNGFHIGSEFYVSQNGTINNLFQLQPEQILPIIVTVRLSQDAPDEYQNQTFTTSLHIAGKQVDEDTSWPETY